MPGPSVAQIHRDGIIFNQITKLLFSNPLFWKCSLESQFQTVFHLSVTKRSLYSQSWVVYPGWGQQTSVPSSIIAQPQRNRKTCGNSLMKTENNNELEPVDCFPPSPWEEGKEGLSLPWQRSWISLILKHITVWCPYFAGKKSLWPQPVLCTPPTKASVTTLAALHRTKQLSGDWSATVPLCLIHCSMQVVVELFLIHSETLLLEVTLIIHVGWGFFFF